MPAFEFKGIFEVEFVGDPEPRSVRILHPVFNQDSHILYLVSDRNTIYNWSNIVSMTMISPNLY